MYWPCTLTLEWVALKCESSQLISAWLLELQYVIVIGFPGELAAGPFHAMLRHVESNDAVAGEGTPG
jgi:hypothetical protein